MMKRCLHALALAIAARLVFGVCTEFRASPFLYDDNLSQWLPVVDFGYNELLHGHFPYWNPYQWTGFRIDNVGFYGFYNPLMFVSHLLSRGTSWDTLSSYCLICYVLGVFAAHRLCRVCGVSTLQASVLALLYGTSLGYFRHGYWYYVFNVFMLMPLALSALIQTSIVKDRALPTALGAATLAAFFYAGNVQYAVYACFIYYVLWGTYAVATKTMPAHGRWLAASLMLLGGMTAPVLVMYAEAGHDVLFKPDLQLEAANLLESCMGIFLPPEVRTRLFPKFVFFSDRGNVGACGLAWLTLLAVPLSMRRRCQTAERRVWLLSAVSVIGFLWVCASGPRFVIYLPVLNRFRVAFKWLFLIPPVALLSAAMAMAKLPRRLTQALMAGAVLVSAVVLWRAPVLPYISESALHPQYVTDYAHKFSQGDRVVSLDGSLWNRRELRLWRANAGTYFRRPCLSGYHLALESAFVPELRAIFDEATWYMGGPLRVEAFAGKTLPDWLRTYAVGSLLVPDRSLGWLLPDLDGDVVSVPTNGMSMVRLRGVKPLVSDALGSPRDFELRSDGIVIPNVQPSDARIIARWAPLRGFRAFVREANGVDTSVPLVPGRFFEATLTGAPAGDLYLTMSAPWSVAAWLAGWVATVVLCVLGWLARLQP